MRKLLLPAALVALAWAAVASITGGIDTRVFGIAIRARSALRPLAISLVPLIAHALLHPEDFSRGGSRVAALVRHHAAAIGASAAVLLSVHATASGSFTAGGADSYGYVSEAYGWARGELPRPVPLPLALPFPSSDLIQTPLGYRVGQQAHTMVPTYAPGLPLLMAVALALLGACGPFLVTPFCSGLLVWFTFLLGRRAGGPTAGAIAAIVVAATPVVLYQALWPMSDVPAAAFWTGAVIASLTPTPTRRNALLAGVCAAIGLLIRPNVLPLVAAPMIGIAWGAAERDRWVLFRWFAAPIAPVPVLVAALNTWWFGSPGTSGYGAARDLYALSNVWPNVRLFSSWFWESESPWALVGVLSLTPAALRRSDPRAVGICVVTMVLTLVCYLPYSPFDAWWYLRFLLPAGGAAATLVALGVLALSRGIPQPWGRAAAGVVLLTLAGAMVSYAGAAGALGGLTASERRYITIGEFVAQTLPANAAILTAQHSGSLRYYGGRMTLRFDFIDKDWAARAPTDIERAGLHPYLMLDDFELPQFRAQFGLPADRRLGWPVVARMRDAGGLTLWDLGSAPARAQPVALELRTRRWCAAPALPLKVR